MFPGHVSGFDVLGCGVFGLPEQRVLILNTVREEADEVMIDIGVVEAGVLVCIVAVFDEL